MPTNRRSPLTRERVLRGAVRLADAEGFEALTMRGLADALGVKAMSLYNHVVSKDDLAAGVIDLVLSDIELPDVGDGDWKAQLRRNSVSAREVLLRHRWAVRLMMGTATPGPARLRWMDAQLGTLRRAGLSAAQTDLAYHALDSHITGSMLWLTSMPFRDDGELAIMAQEMLASPDIQGLPYLVEHIEHHARPPADQPSSFEFGLDLILDGIERMRAGRRGHRQSRARVESA